ncbi:unnamed protein product [Trichobilharzia szidati]|nr:unnamed protein product [Trichobilharzia szidati]
MMATDVSVSGQPCTVAACSYATPQFITLAPGAPLKVMTVGPNGQLIQATGLPQYADCFCGNGYQSTNFYSPTSVNINSSYSSTPSNNTPATTTY